MKKKLAHRLLLVDGGSLFDEALKSLLKQESDLHLACVAGADQAALLEAITQAQPDTILMNETDPQHTWRFLHFLQTVPALAGWQAIIVRLDDNAIDIYERRRIMATQGDDLLTLVRGGTGGS
jgi:DNA-binding NarL/FixJ family response regulator